MLWLDAVLQSNADYPCAVRETEIEIQKIFTKENAVKINKQTNQITNLTAHEAFQFKDWIPSL